MKKEEAILKINKMGKISNIIVRICKILLIMGAVVTILAAILLFVIPKGFITMDMSATADVNIDLSTLGISEEDMQSFETGLVDGFNDSMNEGNTQMTLVLNGTRYEADGVSVDKEGGKVQAETTVDTYTIEFSNLAYVCLMGLVTIVALYITLVFAGRLCRAFRDCQSPFEEKVIKSMNGLAYSLLPWVVLDSITQSITEAMFTNYIEIAWSLDMNVVLVVAVTFILVYIFKYGAVLQQESDETL